MCAVCVCTCMSVSLSAHCLLPPTCTPLSPPFPPSGLSTARRKPTPTEVQNAFSDRPSSRHATMWMGSDTGVWVGTTAVHSPSTSACLTVVNKPMIILSLTHIACNCTKPQTTSYHYCAGQWYPELSRAFQHPKSHSHIHFYAIIICNVSLLQAVCTLRCLPVEEMHPCWQAPSLHTVHGVSGP